MENNIATNQQLNSPQSRRSGKNMAGSSPWNHVVRGESESNSVAPPPLSPSPAVSSPRAVPDQVVLGSVSSDEEISNGGNAGKRPVWNMPSNGALEIGPVMGAVAWPALSEAARVSSKSSLPDGSSTTLPLSFGAGALGSGTSTSSPRKQVNNAIPNSAQNITVPVRQKSFKQQNGPSSSDASSPQAAASQGHAAEGHLNNPFPRDHTQRSSQPRNSSDHSGQQRSSFRNRNGGTHPRADGSNYGGRRDHDRGNQEWNSHRNFNGRDGHVQPQRVAPRFMRHPPPPPPPASTPFIAAPPVRAFGSPMGFPELASPMYYVAAPPPPNLRGMPFVAPMPPHAVFFPAPDFQLHAKIVTQIDYYFSNENLIRDTFLRQNMDEQGWVTINLIAGFKKVSQLTDNIPLILDALRSSIVVEVQGDKVRRRTDWMRWLMPASVQFPSAASPRGVAESSSQDMISDKVQNLSVEEKITGQQSDVRDQSTSVVAGDSNSQSRPSSSNEGTSRVGHDGDLDG
ncbi:La-related protein 1C [Linum grandiflorum]